MRRCLGFVIALLVLPAAASAKQPRCPLPLDSCLVQFGHMHERPWLGVEITLDSLGDRHVSRVVPGSPAQKAGVRAGDVLEQIDGGDPRIFFAGKAGWKTGDSIPLRVRRGARERQLAMKAEHIPEELFARIVGEHILEGHLAYMEPGEGR